MITEKVIKVEAGSYHSVALTVTRQFYTWGYNGKYQLAAWKTTSCTGNFHQVESKVIFKSVKNDIDLFLQILTLIDN